MKRRSLHEGEEVDSITMANWLMLISQSRETPSRLFECKTCNRQFPSFQALGGHRASHKKPKLLGEDPRFDLQSMVKPKSHECSICGVEFPIGQALGGHMRRHRVAGANNKKLEQADDQSDVRKVMCLDLNLTPYENSLQLLKLYQGTFPW